MSLNCGDSPHLTFVNFNVFSTLFFLYYLQDQSNIHVYPDWAAMQVSLPVLLIKEFVPLIALKQTLAIRPSSPFHILIEHSFCSIHRHIMDPELLCHHTLIQLLHQAKPLTLICGDHHRYSCHILECIVSINFINFSRNVTLTSHP